jgi:hypothetical protein
MDEGAMTWFLPRQFDALRDDTNLPPGTRMAVDTPANPT